MQKKKTTKKTSKKKATRKSSKKKTTRKSSKKKTTKKSKSTKSRKSTKSTKSSTTKQSKLVDNKVQSDESPIEKAEAKEKDETTSKTKAVKKKKAQESTKKKIKEIIEVGLNEEQLRNQSSKLENQPDMPEKFWQKGLMKILLDPTLVQTEDMGKLDLSLVISEFTKNMLKQNLVDFRISGLAINSAAKLYHRKIKDVIEEEEKVQLKEIRERAKREIPKAMPQPLRESRKIATQDELFEAMRSAIIETMQKREVLRRRREQRIQRREELKVIRAKGQLPKEILKHITGKEKTIDEIMDSWFEKIRARIKLNEEKNTSYFELRNDIIKMEKVDDFKKKMIAIELFIALLFLSTNGRIIIEQYDDFGDIRIEIPRHII